MYSPMTALNIVVVTSRAHAADNKRTDGFDGRERPYRRHGVVVDGTADGRKERVNEADRVRLGIARDADTVRAMQTEYCEERSVRRTEDEGMYTYALCGQERWLRHDHRN